MLSQLIVKNFAIVKSLDVDFSAGMTAITGETGAGKSISIDALGLCLGDRAEASMVREGAAKAEIIANFDLANNRKAIDWLTQHDLESEQECMLRRVISAEGRSKAYINGTPVALQQLRELGSLLVSVHGQHAHHQLLKSDKQLALLDGFAAHPDLLQQTAQAYSALNQAQKRFQQLLAGKQQREDRRQLLEYQVQELDEFALADDEFAQLETEHKKLSHSQTLLEQAQLSFHALYEAESANALGIVQHSVDALGELQAHDAALTPIVAMLNEAMVNIDEASQELRNYCEQLEIDPLRMQQVEARYAQALDLARKHQVQPENLPSLHQQLADELKQLSDDDTALEEMEVQLNELNVGYREQACVLHKSRQKAALNLAKQVEAEIHNMNMAQAEFVIEVSHDIGRTPTKSGLDEVEFKVSANAGQALDRLEKVVSGGELSRIGLAIQVISSGSEQVPTLIFDEVDTGISGPTATVVGRLLRRLGKQNQVMCVTHLPQVAACAHQQMFVTKFSDKQTTETHMLALAEEERVEALARLLAGDSLTESAIANAKALLHEDED